jgi:trimethyllysine dioxygenase
MAYGVPTITELTSTHFGLFVTFSTVPQPELFTWFWLRDHSEDAASLNQSTLQRQVDTFSLPERPGSGDASLNDAGNVVVRWNDGASAGLFSPARLAQAAGHGAAPTNRHLWPSGNFSPGAALPYRAVLANDNAVRDLLMRVRDVGFGLAAGVTRTPAGAAELAARIGPVRSSIFGTMWPLSSSVKAHDDTAYTNSYLEPHTDSTYCIDAPGLQLFVCLERDGIGGDSVLVDGFAIAEALRREDPKAFETLTTVSVPGHYIEPGVHLIASRPPIRLDEDGNVLQVSFNNYDRAPFRLPEPQMSEFYRAYGELHRRIIDRSGWFTVRLEPGDALVFDNWRCLHGRLEYTGTRVFEGCYHNREDFESKLRVLKSVG